MVSDTLDLTEFKAEWRKHDIDDEQARAEYALLRIYGLKATDALKALRANIQRTERLLALDRERLDICLAIASYNRILNEGVEVIAADQAADTIDLAEVSPLFERT